MALQWHSAPGGMSLGDSNTSIYHDGHIKLKDDGIPKPEEKSAHDPTSSAEQWLNVEPVMEMPPTHQRNGQSGYPSGSAAALDGPGCAASYSIPPKPTPAFPANLWV
ncbi:hypothetical protein Tsubulata_033578 [Turnera subulata]|uniref:Uncharacterized protein n=1 Tax=Turnera subulata TaxID=218843 RepID=A0A9Q0G338_9ROSI|nr:hypothetical protein Tsubulata_033578 [Turnera subulata]